MSSYYRPDTTGVNPLYLQPNIPAVFYAKGIKIAFENSPIFQASLKIALTDGTGTLLVQGTDWEVDPDTDIDTTAMSRAFLQDPNFTGTLIKSITVITTKALPITVAMTFQEFYLTIPGRTFDDGTPIFPPISQE